MNKKQQHAIGIAKAIAHFTEQGFPVFVPVSDYHRYDLVVDTDGVLHRLEVKTTVAQSGDVDLRTMGGNQSWSGEVKRISSDDCDLVFAMNVNTGDFKIIEASELEGRATVRVK